MRGFGIVQIAPEVDRAPRDLDQLALTHQGQQDHTQRQADRRIGRDGLPLMERQPDLGRRQRPIFRHKGRDRDAPAPRSRRDDPRCAERAQDVTGAMAPAPLRPVAGVGDFAGGGRWPWGNLPGPRAWPGPACGWSCDRRRACGRSRVARRRAPRAPEPLVFAVASRHSPPYPLLR